MKNLSRTCYALVGLLIGSAPAAWAFEPITKSGNGAGNGGGTHYCPNPRPGQPRHEAYDLYAGRNPLDVKYKYNVFTYDGFTDKQTYLKRGLEKIAKVNEPLSKAIQRGLDMLADRVQDKGGKVLDKVPDAGDLFHDVGCDYYQLVNWLEGAALTDYALDREVVMRDETVYWNDLNELDRAANDLHEAAAKVRRANGLSDKSGTIWVQRFVAQVFSTDPIDPSIVWKIGNYPEQSGFYSNSLEREIEEEIGRQGQLYLPIVFYLNSPCGPGELSKSSIRMKNIGPDLVSKGPYEGRTTFKSGHTQELSWQFLTKMNGEASSFDYQVSRPHFVGKREAAKVVIEADICGTKKSFTYVDSRVRMELSVQSVQF